VAPPTTPTHPALRASTAYKTWENMEIEFSGQIPVYTLSIAQFYLLLDNTNGAVKCQAVVISTVDPGMFLALRVQ
jgi:hypothetical protein